MPQPVARPPQSRDRQGAPPASPYTAVPGSALSPRRGVEWHPCDWRSPLPGLNRVGSSANQRSPEVKPFPVRVTALGPPICRLVGRGLWNARHSRRHRSSRRERELRMNRCERCERQSRESPHERCKPPALLKLVGKGLRTGLCGPESHAGLADRNSRYRRHTWTKQKLVR